MKEDEQEHNQVNINISPANGFVHFKIADAKGKVITEFNVLPFDALNIAASLTDSSLIARVETMIQKRLNEHK